jgi:prepilin-type N-terminal cleavage/methylation domain-containing protein
MKQIYQKAFTLIELLIVVAILGILSAAVLVAIDPAAKIGLAKDANIKSDMSSISNAMQAYYTTMSIGGTGQYPETMQKLVDEKELKTLPKTPSGGDYTLVVFNASGGTCDNTGTNYCVDAAVYTKLNKPKATNPNGVWCWRASVGKIGETTQENCTNSTTVADFL